MLRRPRTTIWCSTLAVVVVLTSSSLATSGGESPPAQPAEEIEEIIGACPPGPNADESDCAVLPVLLKRKKPYYPSKARIEGIEAQVRLTITIKTDGTVENPVVNECTKTGYGFEKAAVDAVKRWRFKPARVYGEIVPVDLVVNVTFDLGS